MDAGNEREPGELNSSSTLEIIL